MAQLDPAEIKAVLGPGYWAEYAGDNELSIHAGVVDNRDAITTVAAIRDAALILDGQGYSTAILPADPGNFTHLLIGQDRH